jgi:hypothetical protein
MHQSLISLFFQFTFFLLLLKRKQYKLIFPALKTVSSVPISSLQLEVYETEQGQKNKVVLLPVATEKFYLATIFSFHVCRLDFGVLTISFDHLYYRGNGKPHPKKEHN